MNKACPKCDKYTLVEVNKALLSDSTMRKFPGLKSNTVGMYPKQNDPIGKTNKHYNEYRFYCGNCKTECTYDTQSGWIEIIPEDSQFYYNPNNGLLIERI
ncbi:MAG: hypothetical protein NTW06_03085 [Candidatus Falkowbacteria bacterium]|nr:hypothetical protein [Candidatus Falkowbacteria bacterium]